MKSADEFYIGYLPKSPAQTARFTRRVVIGAGLGALVAGAVVAAVLPFYGAGVFEFGHPKVYRGTAMCEGVPRLLIGEIDYWLVGPGKHGAPLEICKASGRTISVEATRIARDGDEALEVVPASLKPDPAPAGINATTGAAADVVLGEFTLRGEIVDPKCYFGVMNPGEGRLHRACAILCLRGGIVPMLVVRDKTGREIHLALTVPPVDAAGLLQRVAEPTEVSGVVRRAGHFLVMDTTLAQVNVLPTR